jgi:PLP dependent protein
LVTIASRLAHIKQDIAQAVLARPTQSAAQLIVVSKGQSLANIMAALAAGHRVFGENRVQEAHTHWAHLKPLYPDLCLHLIGPLQSNKVAQAVALFDYIQTVDRPKIAQMLATEMQKQQRFLPCLVQVNVGLEPQKAGILPSNTVAFVQNCRALGLNVQGLMCIPPANQNAAPYFAQLAQLAKQANAPSLSMGMSADYVQAVQAGAHFVRVGSAVFMHQK